MIMANFLRTRKSVRDFKRKKLSISEFQQIDLVFRELENEEWAGNIRFSLHENGEYIYQELKGIGGYSGVMIESPHYIALEVKDDSDRTIIYSAYYMEKLITKLHDIGIATCWVSITDVEEGKKKEILGDNINTVYYLLAIGYAKPKNPFVEQPFSEKSSPEDIVFDGDIGKFASMDNLEAKGLGDLFFYIRFAPSTKNLQPWRFLIDGPIVKLLIEYREGEKPLLVDAGIIMYYFEALINTQGIKNKWELIDGEVKAGEGNYKYVAQIHI